MHRDYQNKIIHIAFKEIAQRMKVFFLTFKIDCKPLLSYIHITMQKQNITPQHVYVQNVEPQNKP